MGGAASTMNYSWPPVVVISAPRSGEGKTTFALGLMAALAKRGLRVQGFKTGPDYLDTGYQRLATGRPGRNLDLWMMGSEAVLEAVRSLASAVDVVVIEGAMGLFDGHRDGTAPSSTADLAVFLGAPVVLVIDASRAGASLGAMALGFKEYDRRLALAGVVLNKFGIHRSRQAVEIALAKAGVDLLGVLPLCEESVLPSRHLGLVGAREIEQEASKAIARLAEIVEDQIDVERLLGVARQAAERSAVAANKARQTAQPASLPVSEGIKTSGLELGDDSPCKSDDPPCKVRIAVALDDAFSFYYQDNLDALERAGAEIVYFSPCQVDSLPECDGLYLGGGYPELHLRELAAKTRFLDSLRKAVVGGLPTYAECGGLMLLLDAVRDQGGCRATLARVIPATAQMTDRLQALGYREALLASNCLIGRQGEVLRGHEFHYSLCHSDPAWENGFSPAYLIEGKPEGFARGNLFASYVHLHFAGCPQVVRNWLAACRSYQSMRLGQAVVVLGHGSRSAQAQEEFLEITSLLQARLALRVYPAFMELSRPSLEEAVAEAVGAGARELTLVPCFLFSGNHVRHDVPAMLEKLARTYPGVSMRMASPLGVDERLVDLLQERIQQAGVQDTVKRGMAARGEAAPRRKTAPRGDSL